MADLKRNVSSSAIDTTYIQQRAVKALEKKLVMADFITPGDLPQNAGSTIKWQIDANVSGATATNALTNDGGTPIAFSTRASFNEDTYTPTAVSKQMHTYGTFVPVRLQDLKTMPKGMMDRLGDRLAYRGKVTLDTLLRATVDGTGTGFGPGTGSGTTTTRKSIKAGNNNTLISTDNLTAEDVALAVGDLMALDAEPFDNGMYAVIVHTVPRTHLVTDVSTSRLTWEQVNKYVSGFSGQEKLLSGVVGGIAGGMVFLSNNITTATVDTISAYANLVLAKDGLGAAAQGDMNPQVMINKPGANSTDNPYRIFGTVSFLFQTAPALLDVNRAEILYSAA